MNDEPLAPELAPTRLPPAPPRPTAYQSMPTLRTLLAVATLSAVMASTATFGLVSAFGAGPLISVTPTPTSAPTDAQTVASSNQANDLTDVVAAARESVVTITVRGISAGGFSPFNMPATGVGSGIVVSANGLILTNNHVVEGARSLTVETADGQQLDASVVKTDATHDLAVIRATGSQLTPITLGDSDALEVGQTVLAIGSPLGEFTETVTRGIVSALDRSITVGDQMTGAAKQLSGLIQTDAAINPGNSGGPLINERGEVVGINSAVSNNAEGIGFAIPINAAKALVDQAASSAA
jgi:S1-C subfamily serine protease